MKKMFSIRHLVLIWLVWRVLTFFVASQSEKILPFTVTFSNWDVQQEMKMPVFLEKWANFDGGLYLTLIRGGYHAQNLLQAFFPLYPFTSSYIGELLFLLLSPIFHFQKLTMYVVAAIGLSTVSALLMMIGFREYFSFKKLPHLFNDFLLALLLFPYSFYYMSIYTESLFGFIMIMVWLCFYKQKWVWLSFFLVLSSATRLVGIFLIPAVMLDLWLPEVEKQRKNFVSIMSFTLQKFIPQHFGKLVLMSLGALGLACFMVYMAVEFNDPLKFYHVQKDFGAGRESRIILYPQVLWRYVKIFWTARPFDLKYLTYVQEFAFSQFALVTLGWATWKRKALKLGWGELLFSFAAFFLPTFTGNFSSMGRYVMVCYPIFIVVAYYLHRYPKARYVYYPISTLLLLVNLIMYLQGRWVA